MADKNYQANFIFSILNFDKIKDTTQKTGRHDEHTTTEQRSELQAEITKPEASLTGNMLEYMILVQLFTISR